jgi:hypothetical protein
MAAHNDLGAWGENLVRRTLEQVAPVGPGQRADLRCEGLEIEVKTARPSRSDRDRPNPRYQFCLNREGRRGFRADVLVLVLAPVGTCYVVPAEEVPETRVLKLGPRSTRLAAYEERWEVLADLLEAMPL